MPQGCRRLSMLVDEHPRILEAEVSEIGRPTSHKKDAEWVLDFARGEARGVSLLRCSRQD